MILVPTAFAIEPWWADSDGAKRDFQENRTTTDRTKSNRRFCVKDVEIIQANT